MMLTRLFKNKNAGLAGVVALVVLNLVAGSGASAAEKEETYTGYLVDKGCAAMIKHDHIDPMVKLKEHTKSCALDPSCAEAGFTVYSGGKWIDLDSSTSEMAKKILQDSKKNKAHICKITGTFKRNEFHATRVSEVNQ